MNRGSICPPHTRAECLMRVPCTEYGSTARDHPRECRHRAPGSGVDPGCTPAPSSRSAHTSLGQLTPGTLKLFAEKFFWLLHETSSFFQPCLPMPGGGCLLLGRQGGMQSPAIPPSWGAPPWFIWAHLPDRGPSGFKPFKNWLNIPRDSAVRRDERPSWPCRP